MLKPASDSSETRSGADLFAHAKANGQHRRGAGYVVDRLQENLPDKIERQLWQEDSRDNPSYTRPSSKEMIGS
jgi:hypothetical protein